MMPKRLKAYGIFLISLILFPQSGGFIKGCGGYDITDIVNTSMYIPQMIKSKRFDPFFMSIDEYYSNWNYATEPGRNEPDERNTDDFNLDEWQTYFEGYILNDEVGSVVYRLGVSSMDSLIDVINAQNITRSGELKNIRTKQEIKDALLYLKLAKEVEKVIHIDPWDWNPQPFDKQSVEHLKNKAFNSLRLKINRELQLRYTFQYVSLCFHAGAYEEAIAYMKDEFKLKPEDGFMYHRLKGYEAACLVRTGNFSKSNLIYARLYGLGEAFKMTSFESFHAQNEEDWSLTLSLANSDRDKELLWHLFGVYIDPLKGMHAIAEINVNSDLLPLLLVRAVQIAETNTIQNSPYEEYFYEPDLSNYAQAEGYTPDPLYSWGSVLKEHISLLINEILKIESLREEDRSMWLMSAAFLYWMQSDIPNCRRLSNEAVKYADGNQYIILQNAIIELLTGYSETKRLDAENEERLFKLIAPLTKLNGLSEANENTLRFVLTGLKQIYLNQGDLSMAELAEPQPENYYTNEEDIQAMIDFMIDEDKSEFRKFLQGRYRFDLNDLYDVQATSRIYKYDFEGAVRIYKEHPGSGNLELYGNPFNYRKVDCHDCDHNMPQKVKYNKQRFAEKMIELKSKGDDLKTEKTERANNYFLYANGLYNMTYYGNARMVSVTVVNWDLMYSNAQNERDPSDESIFPYHDCREAQKYYLKALQFSSDREYLAKCYWMSAKCEHNIWLETVYVNDNEKDFVAGNYFHLLNDQFSDTKYYSEIIDECGYFCQFNNPGQEFCIRNK